MTLEVPVLDDVSVVFPAQALDWMPAWEAIPKEFKRGNEWTVIANRWFTKGLSAEATFYARPGINAQQAYRAVEATVRSFAPKHEHKIAAVAFMLATWFEKVEGWQ